MVSLFYLGPQCTENLLNVEQRDEVSDDVSVPISTNNKRPHQVQAARS